MNKSELSKFDEFDLWLREETAEAKATGDRTRSKELFAARIVFAEFLYSKIKEIKEKSKPKTIYRYVDITERQQALRKRGRRR